mmetsp:Transcript_15/g.70  ORF Transcript_15/g.70 Transcript_15/m.70 type:complete len:139 (+) Transcript_15:96-512(+)
MAAALTAHSALSSVLVSRVSVSPRTVRCRRCAVKPVRAEDNQRLSFKPNQRSGKGYLDEDSAGQTNIFAVEPTLYTKGGSNDKTSGNTALVGGGAAVLGALILGAAVLGGGVGGGVTSPADEGLLSLTEYVQQFTSGQ